MSTNHPWYTRTGAQIALAALTVPLVGMGASALVSSAASAAPQDSQITDKPSHYTADNTPNFAGTTDPNAVVQVEIDGSGVMSDAGVADATGAWSYDVPTAMPDGEHTFQFRFSDTWTIDAGAFVIDTVAPKAPVWLSAPDVIDGGGIFSVQENADDPGLVYEFGINQDPWESTAGNPQTSSWAVNVNPGWHVMRARAVDLAGNAGPFVTKRFGATSPPDGIQLVSAPDAVSAVREPTFAFSKEGATSWEYTLNGTGPISFSGQLTLPSLVPSNYFLEVTSVDPDGRDKYTYAWTVQAAPAVAPVVRYVSGPTWSEPTVVREANFEFAADKPVRTWLYTFDGGAPVMFSSGAFTLTQVPVGEHTVSVTAADAEGNVSTPVHVSWTVVDSPTTPTDPPSLPDPTDPPTPGDPTEPPTSTDPTDPTELPGQTVIQGGSFVATVDGWSPEETVKVRLGGKDVVTQPADAQGILRTTVGVPLDLAVGEHTVEFIGESVTRTMKLTVNAADAPPPLAIDPLTPPTLEELNDPESGLHGTKLTAGDALRFSEAGFAPGETVQAWLLSDPQLLASYTADDAGVADGEVVIPVSTAAGQHHFVLRGVNTGELRYLPLIVEAAPTVPGEGAADGPGAEVAAEESPDAADVAGEPLPVTGANSGALVGWAAGLLTAGAAVILIGRTRRSRDA